MPEKKSENISFRQIKAELIAEVAVALSVNERFHYLVPDELSARLQPGMRVLVPFGRRTVTAYLLGFVKRSEHKSLKEIISSLDDEPLWTAEQLRFFNWIADYYLYPLADVFKAALPVELNKQNRQQGCAAKAGNHIKKERWFLRTDAALPESGLRGKNKAIIEFLDQVLAVSAAELRSRFGECSPNLKKLQEKGLVLLELREVYRNPFAGLMVAQDQPKQLSSQQQAAFETIVKALDTNGFMPFLLHGVTGSGKTEIYLQAISHCLAGKRTALVLVPEISLTPQLVHRFRARFGDKIAVLHSGLSSGERYDEWRRIRRSQVDIVIGARSAIFAPLANIGIIVVDEEHEASFKQSDGLRYNARDLALVRGSQENAVVVLGSATPLVSSRYAAATGRLGYLSLSERVHSRPLPEVKLISAKVTAENPLSPVLISALTENLARGEQSLLFINRRGYATILVCPSCSHQLSCPNCSVSLTYHKSRNSSICHYCDYQVPFPCICPACGDTDLKELGSGTERIEHELELRFPEARIIRMDSDTVAGKGGHARVLDQMAQGKADILIGTQMVAKGHDFPGVTLVGVLQGEGSLFLPDFRAAERTFQLLTQVIGRAGRGDLPGRVLIQATQPDHYAVKYAANHDYDGFYAEELGYRQELCYPPAGYLAAIAFSGTSEKTVGDTAAETAKLLVELKAELGLRTELLGPAQAPFYRLRGRFRMQLLLKDQNRTALRRLLKTYMKTRKITQGTRITIDIDPVDLL